MWTAIELRVRLRRCNRPAVQTKTAIHQVSHSFKRNAHKTLVSPATMSYSKRKLMSICLGILVDWVIVPVLTWLLWMEMAQASLSGSCCRLRWTPPPDLNTQRSGFSTSVTPHRKRTRGSPEGRREWVSAQNGEKSTTTVETAEKTKRLVFSL